ncbi:MAG: radical SAM protein [Candidatus Diapherotrites archaeon]|nr:radical SAM protein [Candidatus Diapherotrites archaeon]
MAKIHPSVPIIYQNKFPSAFSNKLNGWGYSKEELQLNKGKLLTLDIDFGNMCSLNCPHCFRKDNRVDSGKNKLMSYSDIVNLVREAKKLGLKDVKFLGAGEPFQDKKFLDFLRELKKLDVIPCIFTKGHVIGDDSEVAKWFGHEGITTGEQLVAELNKVNASILLGFNSFDPKVQDHIVGGVPGYTLKRNRALELLVKAGFNKASPTRLLLASNPITKENYSEIFEIYSWARVRNLLTIVCPTMVSGRCGEEDVWRKITPAEKELVALYTKIYEFNIEKGIQTFSQIKEEGISAYAGIQPCNQIACGMYVTLTGKVLRCPGDDVTEFGSIWDSSLENIWKNSENFKRAGTFNCQCPPKAGKSIPSSLYSKVLDNLKHKYGKV